MEEADFECSLNSRLLTRHINLLDNLLDDWDVYEGFDLNFGEIPKITAHFVAAIEDEKEKRLRDARSTIKKLEKADSIVGELCHADMALPTNASEHPTNNVSRSAKLGNISSSSPLTITQQSIDFERSQNHSLTSIQRSPIGKLAQLESDPIQVHDPEGDSSNHTESNLDSTNEISSARKRKRQSTKDPTKFKHECNTCGERFTRSTTLREHSRTHTNERPFPCSSCSKTFARKKDKTRHENLHLGEKTFYCRLEGRDAEGGCGRCFTREDGLIAHLRTDRGWKCLQDLMASTDCRNDIEILFRRGNGFSCVLTQHGCHGKFDDLSDLIDHLQDRANKDCATDWLTKTFLLFIRINRFSRNLQDKDPDASEAERSDNSRHPTSQDRQEPSTSAPHDPRSRNDALELLSDVAGAMDLPSPARRIIKTSRQNETMEIDQSTTVSRLGDGRSGQDDFLGPTHALDLTAHYIQSTEASACDFDPFASWDLSSIQCCWTSQSHKLEIDINCTQEWPTTFYSITVGDEEKNITKVFWFGSISTGFRVTLVIDCGLMIHPSQAVSLVYHPNQSYKKKLPLGTLDYDVVANEYSFVPRPQQIFPKSPQLTPANAEAIGNEVTSIEKSPSVRPGNNHQAEQSSSSDVIVNNPTQPFIEAISQSASITDSASMSDWKILNSYCFSVMDRCIELHVVLEYPGGNVPNRLARVPSFEFKELGKSADRTDRRSTMVQASRSFISDKRFAVYEIYHEWYYMRAVAVHLHLGSADAKLFVGTRRFDNEGRLVWHQALPRETCPCSSCI
jgi:hypothetical protein